MSNALLVTANHAAGHPVAVFGPQVSYFAPQILSQLDLHSPHYSAEGASFPGTGIVELGRGEDYAWSATSAGSDVIDTRLEKMCKPGGGRPGVHGTHYLFKGRCRSMVTEHYDRDGRPQARRAGRAGHARPCHPPHRARRRAGLYDLARQAGRDGQQRSTYNHDVDSVVGFLAGASRRSPMTSTRGCANANKILYTFNWFYADNNDIGYYVSGRDPIRPRNVRSEPAEWGTGRYEWRGFLPADQHVHEVDPKSRVPRQLEQQAGARVRGRRRPVRLRPGLSLDHAGRPARAAVRRSTTTRSRAPTS